MVLDGRMLTEALGLPERKTIVFNVDTKDGMAIRDLIRFGKVSNDQFTIFEVKVELTAGLRADRNLWRIGRSVTDNENSFKVKALSADDLMQLQVIHAILDLRR
jgi:hypothetical protein